MRVIVTCGPSFEPIDEVRRITNASTGELGVRLTDALRAAGIEVILLKGSGATWRESGEGVFSQPFDTNADLLEHLKGTPDREGIAAVFHAAALCDFQVRKTSHAGSSAVPGKIPSQLDQLVIELEPAPKVLAELRALFPQSLLVGWKYEVDGDRASAIQKAWRQIIDNRSNACVVNGRAYGSGFGFCQLPERLVHLEDKPALATFLQQWVTATYN